jgi:hypothetical protein
MGYHLILNSQNENIKSTYIKDLKELLEINDLNENCIIYQGEEHWTPVRLSESKEYHKFTKEWFRAGLKAQNLFKNQALAKGYIFEEINQDVESFKNYTINAKTSIKRGDFIFRNVQNVEVEVKCRTFYGKTKKPFFYFSIKDFDGHKGMMAITNAPVIIAIFERNKDCPIKDSLRMISLEHIISNQSKFKIQEHNDSEVGKAFQIPLSETFAGFELLESLKNR